MKKLTYLIIAMTLIVATSVTSCKKITDLLEITLRDVVFDVDVNASELTTKNDGFGFGGTATLNPAGNSDLAPYLSTIRRVEIKEIKVTVTSVSPATGLELLDASFSLTDNTNSDNFTYTVSTATPLTVGTEIILDSSTPNFDKVSDIISALHSSTVSLQGHVNQTGFTIGFNYSIKADITVGVPEGDK